MGPRCDHRSLPFRRLGTISSDSATASSWTHDHGPGSAAGLSPCATHSAAPGDSPPRSAQGSDRGGCGPSFLIRGSQASQSAPQPSPAGPAALVWSGQPRLDRVNSVELLRQARAVYFGYLSQTAALADPQGIVLSGSGGGRVVFDLPVLLPEELFVPIDWLRGRPQGRGRGGRGTGGRPSS